MADASENVYLRVGKLPSSCLPAPLSSRACKSNYRSRADSSVSGSGPGSGVALLVSADEHHRRRVFASPAPAGHLQSLQTSPRSSAGPCPPHDDRLPRERSFWRAWTLRFLWAWGRVGRRPSRVSASPCEDRPGPTCSHVQTRLPPQPPGHLLCAARRPSTARASAPAPRFRSWRLAGSWPAAGRALASCARSGCRSDRCDADLASASHGAVRRLASRRACRPMSGK